ncbi:proliferating cell nuclear antigen [Ancistrocladus abbreviatus]
MFRLKVQQAWVLKRVLAAIINVGPTAFMEILPSGLLLRVTNMIHDVFIVLRMNAVGFHHYTCDRNYIINVNIREFSAIINSADDDDAISIFGEDPPNLLYFVFVNQNCDESRNASLPASEVDIEHWVGEEWAHEFRVCIRSEDFAHILEHSKLNNEASEHFLFIGGNILINEHGPLISPLIFNYN